MSHLSFFLLILFSVSAFCQKRWDGGGGNNQWSNSLNWTGNTLPGTADDVLLDNSIVTTSYSVVLPNTAVTIRTIKISPAVDRAIDVTLPSTNVSVPGFSTTGPGYGMVIDSGGTFRNSSGSSSGAAVNVLDSIKINNSGRYVHNTSSSHATNVMLLSRALDTERGVFEFNVPSASATLSFSGRTFGRLTLRSAAAGGACNYTAVGTSRVAIRHTLDIGAGVNLNLNFSDTISVRHLLQDAGTLNLGNSTRSVVMHVQQNITQIIGGIITETGTGIQTILLSSEGSQNVNMRGTVQNSVILKKDGTGDIQFKAPVSLPYKFVLRNGIVNTTLGLVTLQPTCTIEADSLKLTAYVEGPLRKDGLNNQSFLFPVGKSGALRWLQLFDATGSFAVEYFKEDPHGVSGAIGAGIDHLSSVEYWDVNTPGAASGRVKLSFNDPYSGGVTNLASLRVARLINGIWEDAGNTGVSGTPGSDGWVSSNAASGFSATSKTFALASAMGLENPLPISSFRLQKIESPDDLIFHWTPIPDLDIVSYELQYSHDGKRFKTIRSITPSASAQRCSLNTNHAYSRYTDTYYRIVARSAANTEYFSNSHYVKAYLKTRFAIAGSNVATSTLKVFSRGDAKFKTIFVIYDTRGKVVKKIERNTVDQYTDIDISALAGGMYYLKPVVVPKTEYAPVLPFVKL